MKASHTSEEELRRQRDAYAAAMHELVNAVNVAVQAISSHQMGGAVDWGHTMAVLTGRRDVSAQAHLTPPLREQLDRRVGRDKVRDRVALAVLECVNTLRLLDRLGSEGGEVPFSGNVARALQGFESVREMLTWIIYPDAESKGE